MHDTHDVRKSQKLDELETDFSVNLMVVKESQKRIKELKKRVFALEADIQAILSMNKEHGDRLHALEEKDRQRAYEKHQKELSLDEYVPPKEGEY